MPIAKGKGTLLAAMARRSRYIQMRSDGVSQHDALRELGVDDYGTSRRYERWYQAVAAGDIPPPPVNPPGRPRRTNQPDHSGEPNERDA